jgi:hypothetical protein
MMPSDGRHRATARPCDSWTEPMGYYRGINARVVSLACVCLRIIIGVKAASYDSRRRARSRHYRIAGRDPSVKRHRGSGGCINRRPEEVAALSLPAYARRDNPRLTVTACHCPPAGVLCYGDCAVQSQALGAEPAEPLRVGRLWIPRQSVRFGCWPSARPWSSCRSRSLPLQSSATNGGGHAHSRVSRRKPLGTLRSGRRGRSPLVN